MPWSLSNLRREFDWLLKRCLRWSAPVVARPLGDFAPFEARLSDAERARLEVLRSIYEIDAFPSMCNITQLFQCVHRLDILDRHVGETPPGGLDVGALNWTYLPALAAFKPGPWDGYELDGYQRYVSMDTRGAQGRRKAALVDGATYHVGSIMDVTGQWGLVTWFLPYVTPGPLVSAGLPDRFFDPLAMLEHVWSLVAPGGALLVMNVDLDEDTRQAALFRGAGIDATRLGLVTSAFDDEEDENHFWVATKPAAQGGYSSS